MSKRQRLVNYIEVTTFIYATEDETKVRKTFMNLVPQNVDLPPLSTTKLQGYFGDPIINQFMKIHKRRESTEAFEYIVNRLSSLDQATLLEELENRIDDSRNLYLRLDKQKLFRNQFALGERDPVKLKIRLNLPHKIDAIEYIGKTIQDIIGRGEV
jgi:RNA binding exosome subunit